ncbi:MAG: hypothetical protein GW903_03420 [Alphaproteobacteria bacterium]|nr:hypothetical protein [Alphaproteobacteria bacterium]NCQ88019.1 hypothetical protein [Alphaproteobacteria bacterium]NCT05474.1 hypothetical protein [Alphaproteobacteria bacterium]
MPSPVKRWVKDHDERMSFILVYVGAAIVLSVYANLFWVALLMIGHYGLEVWRHYVIEAKRPLLTALWHVKLDIALVLFALVIALYADLVMAALGLGQAARAGQAVRGAQMLTRFAIIERGLRIFFLTIDDIARIGMIVWKVMKGKNSKISKTKRDMDNARLKLKEEEERIHPQADSGKLSKGDIFSLSFGTLCLALIFSAPWITGLGVNETAITLINELKP